MIITCLLTIKILLTCIVSLIVYNSCVTVAMQCHIILGIFFTITVLKKSLFQVTCCLCMGYALLAVLLAVALCVYVSASTRIYSTDIKIAQGDYVLLPYWAHSSNLMYGSEIRISHTDELVPVDIYVVAHDMLHISFESVDPQVSETNFTNCSTQVCFFDSFVYVAKSDLVEPAIAYNISINEFLPEITDVLVLAYQSELSLNMSKPLKAVTTTDKNLVFNLTSEEVKVSSYYSFGVKFNDESTINEISFNRIGDRAYYNASNISLWCTINGTKSSCIYSTTVKEYCFLAHVQANSTQVGKPIVHLEKRLTTTQSGYSIIASIAFVLSVIFSIATLLSCFRVMKFRKKRQNGILTSEPQFLARHRATNSNTQGYSSYCSYRHRAIAANLRLSSVTSGYNSGDDLLCASKSDTNEKNSHCKQLISTRNNVSILAYCLLHHYNMKASVYL